jgi:hypothetical protein
MNIKNASQLGQRTFFTRLLSRDRQKESQESRIILEKIPKNFQQSQ